MLTVHDLYDLSHSLAGEYLKEFTYPWEALAGISDWILEIGKRLPEEEYVHPKDWDGNILEDVWVAKDATVFKTAYLHGPCIIGHRTEVRQCAFIRGSALVGNDCVVGTIAPNPFYTDEIAVECMEKIFLPTIRAMRAEGRTFRGCLYFGLMLTPDGPKVIEYNCRFGDPETQVVLPLLESDLLTVMQATTNGTLKDTPVRFKTGSACCCVVMASQGYPQSYKTGFPITMDTDAAAHTFVAGAKLREDGVLVTSGGRVAGVTAVQPTLEQAVQAAYERVGHVHFENAYYRRDIGARALQALREEK